MPVTAAPTLFDKYGGVATVRSLVRAFFERVQAKPTLRRYFEDTDRERLVKHQIDLITFALGKPPADLDVQRLPESHHSRAITRKAFEDTIGILRQVLLEANVEGGDIALMLSRLDAIRHHIVRDAVAPSRRFNPDHVDALTGLGNRAAMDGVLDAELSSFRTSAQPFSLALARMVAAGVQPLPDDSPSLNLLVRSFSGAFARVTRGSDELFRLDDGRFAVALRRTSAEMAMQAARRLRHALARDTHVAGVMRHGVDLEIGVASATPATAEPGLLIEAATAALQRAAASATQKVQQA